VPAAVTAMDGVNAGRNWSSLTLAGVVQVWPSSSDDATAMALTLPKSQRLSSQVTYMPPVAQSTAAPGPVPVPLPADLNAATVTGAVQVSPWSAERVTAIACTCLARLLT
jgi:hypothetical protein